MTNTPSLALSNVSLALTLADAPALAKCQRDGLLSLSDLPIDAEPLVPLAPDDADDQPVYTSLYQSRCGICRSPIRQKLVAEYIRSGKNVSRVVKYLREVWGVSISWASVNQHMNHHEDLMRVGIPGLTTLADKVGEYYQYRFRERELAYLGLIETFDRLLAIDTARNPELAVKVSNAMRPIIAALNTFQDDSDRAALAGVNICEILFDLHRGMVNVADRVLIEQKVATLRKQLGEFA